MRIWVDDVREMPQNYDVWFRTVADTIKYMYENWNSVELISFDHDAGDYSKFGGDYIKILDWVELVTHTSSLTPDFKFHFHSGNSVGLSNMLKIAYKNGWEIVTSDKEED